MFIDAFHPSLIKGAFRFARIMFTRRRTRRIQICLYYIWLIAVRTSRTGF